ncbi:MAG TPA: hypothetical protein VIV84_08355 [Burkholderiaceae bacterium]
MLIFSIKDVVDVPGVGESRMSSHFSQAPCGANSTARKPQRKAVFPLRTRFSPSEEAVVSHAGITETHCAVERAHENGAMNPRTTASTSAIAITAITAMLAACALADTAAPKETVLTAQASQPTWPSAIQAALPAMLADAARRAGLAQERLRVETVEAVTWPDGALGCPQPDRAYTQALVPGWRVVIAAPGTAGFFYHLNRRGSWLWCPADRAQPAVPDART